MDWSTAVATGASFTALLGAGAVTLRFARSYAQRHRLRSEFHRILLWERRVAAVVSDAQEVLLKGVGWTGIDFMPPGLGGHVRFLEEVESAMAAATAKIRALDSATSGVERLRADMEGLARSAQRAAAKYHDGVISCYCTSQGHLSGLSAAGRMISPLLEGHQLGVELALNEERAELVRALAWRFDADLLATTYVPRLPVREEDFASVSVLRDNGPAGE